MVQEFARLLADQASWTILDLSLERGSLFVDTRRAWKAQATGAMLHYVVVAQDVPAAREFLSTLPQVDDSAAQQIYPGLNRLLLDEGLLSLTLCVGPVSSMLPELRMQADVVFLSAEALKNQDTELKQLVLNCHAGALIYIACTRGLDANAFAHHGIQLQDPKVVSIDGFALARYTPRRDLKRGRRTVNQVTNAARCAVIGAGLSGAAVAHAMALRGWQVTVYETHTAPAGGASGLPAGLCVAQTSSDVSPYTRLSRQGVRICLGHARQLLAEGTDWQPTGVLEKVDSGDSSKSVIHRDAAWLKPAALVCAWLRHERIHFAGGNAVTALVRDGSRWILRGSNAQDVGFAEHVVFANAIACKALIESLDGQVALADDVLRKLGAMQPVHGSLSFGPDNSRSATTPMNGSGSWIAGVPGPAGARWYAGASYETDLARLQNDSMQHASNLQRLRMLCDSAANTMAVSLAENTIGIWRSTRCVTHDRLPLVGPLEATSAPTLWICAGMGSRGLSLASLSAELLAAYIHSEPLPLEHSLSKSLFVNRPARGRRAQQALDFPD